MNRQEAFTKIVRGLRKQGCRAFNGTCKLLTEDGKRCALGQLMQKVPEDIIEEFDALEETFNNYDPSDQKRLLKLIKIKNTKENIEFLNDMQKIHDVGAALQGPFETVLDKLKSYAAQNNLIYPRK